MTAKLPSEFVFELDEPLEYAYKGDPAEATFITLLAPTSKQMDHCAFLKQAFFRAIPRDIEEKDEEEDKSDPVTGAGIMQLILMSRDVDFGPVLITGRELLTSGVALIEGETKLNKPLAEKLGMDVLEKMVGEYMANFILASELQKMKKTS